MADISKKFDALLEKFLPKFLKAIKIDFGIGSAVGITNAKLDGKKTTANPLSMNKKDQKANVEMIGSLINDANTEVAKKINYLVNKAATEKWDSKMLANELSNLDLEETYKGRFKTIANTESFRLMENGSFKTANRLGAEMKWLSNPMDGKTGEDSVVSQEKYGSPDKAIPISEPFEYVFNGKTREFMHSPDRPNDRSQTLYLFE